MADSSSPSISPVRGLKASRTEWGQDGCYRDQVQESRKGKEANHEMKKWVRGPNRKLGESG